MGSTPSTTKHGHLDRSGVLWLTSDIWKPVGDAIYHQPAGRTHPGSVWAALHKSTPTRLPRVIKVGGRDARGDTFVYNRLVAASKDHPECADLFPSVPTHVRFHGSRLATGDHSHWNYVVLERCVCTLADVCRSGRHFTNREICTIALRMVRALRHLHTVAGVLHTDVAPSNIFIRGGLDEDIGSVDVGGVVLADFGHYILCTESGEGDFPSGAGRLPFQPAVHHEGKNACASCDLEQLAYVLMMVSAAGTALPWHSSMASWELADRKRRVCVACPDGSAHWLAEFAHICQTATQSAGTPAPYDALLRLVESHTDEVDHGVGESGLSVTVEVEGAGCGRCAGRGGCCVVHHGIEHSVLQQAEGSFGK